MLAGVAIVGEEPVQTGLGRAISAGTLRRQVLSPDPWRHRFQVRVSLVDLFDQVLGAARTDSEFGWPVAFARYVRRDAQDFGFRTERVHDQDRNRVRLRSWFPVQLLDRETAHLVAKLAMDHLKLLRDLRHDRVHLIPPAIPPRPRDASVRRTLYGTRQALGSDRPYRPAGLHCRQAASTAVARCRRSGCPLLLQVQGT